MRGARPDRAALGADQGAARDDPSSLPFDNVLACNIGNPQAVGQQPISFSRQVHALMTCPDLLAAGGEDLPADAIARAKEYLTSVPEGVGAYSESQGFAIVRQRVADFIAERDGVPANPRTSSSPTARRRASSSSSS